MKKLNKIRSTYSQDATPMGVWCQCFCRCFGGYDVAASSSGWNNVNISYAMPGWYTEYGPTGGNWQHERFSSGGGGGMGGGGGARSANQIV